MRPKVTHLGLGHVLIVDLQGAARNDVSIVLLQTQRLDNVTLTRALKTA
jgi:hypothetical protein